jgi:mono/diheme cytochrome c family protein
MKTTRFTAILLIAISFVSIAQRNLAFGQSQDEVVAGKARDIFTANCLRCHGGKRTLADLKILDRDRLVANSHVVPKQPDNSLIYQRITATDDSAMPPEGNRRLNADEIATIKAWIAAGAPAFPVPGAVAVAPPVGGLGMEDILGAILQDVRELPISDRKYMRYFSVAHRANAGADRAELTQEFDALAKTINHLSWQPNLVRLTPVKPLPGKRTRTLFRIDLRSLGWDKQPYKQVKDSKFVANSKLNIFDLALLEYPYGVISMNSKNYDALEQEFLKYADQARPIPYVRADWFVSTVTQPPLYEDFLQLPRTLKELETLLGVDSANDVASFNAVRGGMVTSGVSRNNRVVEWHATKYGSYWKSFDFQSSQGTDNIFNDLINLKPSGGEMIFTLPNGLQAYFIVNAKEERLDAAPTSIVVDANASDKTVRNGLSCMRCHERGMIPFADVVRPTLQKLGSASTQGMNVEAVLKLYPEQSKLDTLLNHDKDRFMLAMEQVLGKPQTEEPLKPVARQFLDDPLRLADAGSELGLSDSAKLKNAIRSPQLVKLGLTALIADGDVRRDAWQENFERLVRGLRFGIPLIPVDGLTAPNFEPGSSVSFDLKVKTNKAGNVFQAKDEIIIFVEPTKDVFIEMIGTSASGKKVLLAKSTTQVKAGKQFRFPPEGQKLNVKAGAGKETITVFASEKAFEEGELLRGDGVADRVLHRDVPYQFNPFKTVKKTITIESR